MGPGILLPCKDHDKEEAGKGLRNSKLFPVKVLSWMYICARTLGKRKQNKHTGKKANYLMGERALLERTRPESLRCPVPWPRHRWRRTL